MSTARILVVDDEPDLRTLYELTLLREGYEVESADTLHAARTQLQARQFDIVITDMRLPDGLGLELLHDLHQQHRPERAIIITAYGSTDNAIQALRYGAFDYLTKPIDLRQFRTVITSAVRGRQPATGTYIPTAPVPTTTAAQPPSPPPPPAGQQPILAPAPIVTATATTASHDPATQALSRLIGDSPAMQQVRQRIRKVASSMAPVLITGESGTGKELAARALHACSHRAHAAWVAVNCGAIPEHLLEAEFFGARKGAYTGAHTDRPGFFLAARGGTLFLDEIGELPLSMQAKLLRAIQERSVRPLGAIEEEVVDVRIISATHRDLAAEVQAGRFRQDLYYRLNVIDIALPPLRDRRQDLPQLCATLLHRISTDTGLPPPTLPPALLDRISQAALPGNVRELENLLHRLIALGEEHIPTPPPIAAASTDHPTGHTTPAVPAAAPAPLPLPQWLDTHERTLLLHTLHICNHDPAAAARHLGISPRQLQYRMQRLHIRIPT